MALLQDSATCEENHFRFVTRVAEYEEVWGLKTKQGGWAFCESNEDEDADVLLFWSDMAYARRAKELDFPEHEVASITLFDFLFRWLPGMCDDSVLAGTNWTADLCGLEVDPLEQQAEILHEMPANKADEYKSGLKRLLSDAE